MYNVGNYLINIVMLVATLWIVNRYLGIFCKKKRMNILSTSVWGFFAVFQLYVQMNSGAASIWTTIISVILVMAIVLTGYFDRGKMIFLEVIILYVVWSLTEMIVYFCMSVIPLEKADADMIGTVISKIIMIIGVYLFSLIWKRTEHNLIPSKYYMGLLFVPIGSIYIAVNEFYSKGSTGQLISSMVTFSILLLFNIIILEIYSKISENFLLEKEKAIYTQQINMMSINTEEQKKVMENFHRERHDLINKLIVIKNELENDGEDAVIQNIEDIIQNCHTGKIISDSGNKCIDALINVKYAIAKERGIDFILKIFIPEDLPINQCDIGIVLGNALDNAIEATEKCESYDKKIEITMGIKKEALVIVIKNPYENLLKADKNGNLLSTKKDFYRHGYGISSMKRVVEKYYGDIIMENELGKFVVTITMNLGEF